MSGLDATKEHILEIAIVMTDGNLSQSIIGPSLILQCPLDVLNSMDEWN